MSGNERPPLLFIRVVCNNHKRPWKIATFSRDLPAPGWQEVQHASKTRRLEQRSKQSMVDAKPSTPDEKFDVNRWVEDIIPAGDRPLHSTRLVDGEPTSFERELMARANTLPPLDSGIRAFADGRPYSPPRTPDAWTTYDLTCPRCKRSQRHATYLRHEDDLFLIFDELLHEGIKEVTPEFLHQYETRRDDPAPKGTSSV